MVTKLESLCPATTGIAISCLLCSGQLGAVGFWLPDVILHALRNYDFNWRNVRVVTIVSPLTFLFTAFLAKWAVKHFPQKQVVPAMLAGVWLFGRLFMMVGASFAGGGFAKPHSALPLVITLLLSIFPMYTFITATYDGALGALVLVMYRPHPSFLWLIRKIPATFQSSDCSL